MEYIYMTRIEFNDLAAKLKNGYLGALEAILSEQKLIKVDGKKYTPDEFCTALQNQMQPAEAPANENLEKMKTNAGIKRCKRR